MDDQVLRIRDKAMCSSTGVCGPEATDRTDPLAVGLEKAAGRALGSMPEGLRGAAGLRAMLDGSPGAGRSAA